MFSYQLLEGTEKMKVPKAEAYNCLRMARRCGLVLGCIMGCFLESAVLGAFFVLNNNQAQEGSSEGEQLSRPALVGVMLWCLATALAAATVCSVLRHMVWTVFVAASHYETAGESDRLVLEKLIGLVSSNVEVYFGSGCLVGMCTLWAVTFSVLGMNENVLHSLWLGVGASFVWGLMIHSNEAPSVDEIFSDEADDNTIDISDDEEEKLVDPPTAETGVPLIL